MQLISEAANFNDVNFLTEQTENGKQYYIEGIFMQSDVQNRNGRSYPQQVLFREATRYDNEYIKNNRAYGELGHPQGPTINLERACVMHKELRIEGKNVIGKSKVLDTPYGRIVKNLIDEGASLGVSSRGMGTTSKKNGVNEVNSDFYLATPADVVADPSAPSAFVQGIMEGVDWVFVNNQWVPQFVDQAQQRIKTAPKSQINETALSIWQEFVSRL